MILVGLQIQLADLVGVLGETAQVTDGDPALDLTAPDLAASDGGDAVSGDAVEGDAVAGSAGAVAVVTVLDRFLAAGVSREAFDADLAAGRIAVGGRRVTDPATPAPHPMAVAIMLDAGDAGEGQAARA